MVLITNSLEYDLIGIIVTLLAGGIVYLKWKFSYFARKGLYTPPTVLPFGNTKSVFTKKQLVAEWFKDVYFDIKSKGLKHSQVNYADGLS